VKQKHDVGISHEVPVLFTVMAQGHKPVSVSTGSNLLDREWHIAGHRDTDGMDAAEQLIEILRKFVITVHRLVSFLQMQEALGARAGGFP
jgi:hypothetical protein